MKYPQRIMNAFKVANLIRDYYVALKDKTHKEALEKMNQAIAIRIQEGYRYGYSTGQMPLINCLMRGINDNDFGVIKNLNEIEKTDNTNIWDLKEVYSLNEKKIEE